MAQSTPRPPKPAPSPKSLVQAPDTNPNPVPQEVHSSLPSGAKEIQPASVVVKNGTLVVEANNSDLGQILRDVSSATGMVVIGNVRDTRVFGHYGPQDPPTLLNALLTGLGYNIVMVGTAREGAPRELQLTTRTGGPTPAVPPNPSDEEQVLGEGAIAHPPPQQIDDLNMRQYLNQQKMQKMQDAREKQQNNSQ